jgi:hypothetical protein
VAYRELVCATGPFLIPTTTPVQFDPQALHASIDALMARRPRRMYLTHYGAIPAGPDAAAGLHAQIDAYAQMASETDPAAPDARAQLCARLLRYTLARLRAAGCGWREAPLARFLALDMDLNADGLLHWRRTAG